MQSLWSLAWLFSWVCLNTGCQFGQGEQSPQLVDQGYADDPEAWRFGEAPKSRNKPAVVNANKDQKNDAKKGRLETYDTRPRLIHRHQPVAVVEVDTLAVKSKEKATAAVAAPAVRTVKAAPSAAVAATTQLPTKAAAKSTNSLPLSLTATAKSLPKSLSKAPGVTSKSPSESGFKAATKPDSVLAKAVAPDPGIPKRIKRVDLTEDREAADLARNQVPLPEAPADEVPERGDQAPEPSLDAPQVVTLVPQPVDDGEEVVDAAAAAAAEAQEMATEAPKMVDAAKTPPDEASVVAAPARVAVSETAMAAPAAEPTPQLVQQGPLPQISPSGKVVRYILTPALNVRSQPALDAPVVRSYCQGQRVQVSLQGEWAMLREGEWVRTKYLADGPLHHPGHSSSRAPGCRVNDH